MLGLGIGAGVVVMWKGLEWGSAGLSWLSKNLRWQDALEILSVTSVRTNHIELFDKWVLSQIPNPHFPTWQSSLPEWLTLTNEEYQRLTIKLTARRGLLSEPLSLFSPPTQPSSGLPPASRLLRFSSENSGGSANQWLTELRQLQDRSGALSVNPVNNRTSFSKTGNANRKRKTSKRVVAASVISEASNAGLIVAGVEGKKRGGRKSPNKITMLILESYDELRSDGLGRERAFIDVTAKIAALTRRDVKKARRSVDTAIKRYR